MAESLDHSIHNFGNFFSLNRSHLYSSLDTPPLGQFYIAHQLYFVFRLPRTFQHQSDGMKKNLRGSLIEILFQHPLRQFVKILSPWPDIDTRHGN